MKLGSDFQFHVALSFAGEDREIAEGLAISLKDKGVRVFYDSHEQANLWGKNLYVHLIDVYQKQAQFCIMLLSESYAKKVWTNHERAAAQARAFSENSEYILPLRLDGTEIPGVLSTTGYINYFDESIESICEMVLLKINSLVFDQSKNLPPSGRNINLSPIKPKNDLIYIQNLLENIYSDVNKTNSVEYQFAYLSRTVGYLCRNILAGSVKVEDFMRPISWLFALSSKLGIEVQDSVITKYPECCPYCLENSCICFKTKKQPRKDMEAFEIRDEMQSKKVDLKNRISGNPENSFNLDYTKGIISKIYSNNEIIWHYSGPFNHFYKLQEEVSELHEAISGYFNKKKSIDAVGSEVADVLAWILGAWHILYKDKSLDKAFINYFIDGCPVCKKITCDCDSYNSRSIGLVDGDFLVYLKQTIEKISWDKEDRKVVSDIISSIGVSIDMQNDPLSRITLNRVRSKLNLIANRVNADSITGPSKKLISSQIGRILDLLDENKF
jgi:hypothetical protein